MLGNRGPALQAAAFNPNTLFTIIHKLPYTLVNRTYDLTEDIGYGKLKKVLTMISKARAKASARATDQTNMGMSTKASSLLTTQPADSSQVVVAPPQRLGTGSRFTSWS